MQPFIVEENAMTFNMDILATKMKQQFPEVLFAFIFGSSKDGLIRNGGDVDIAVWIRDPKNKLELIPRLVGMIESETPGVQCDLVFLNEAGAQLSFEALGGNHLFVRDEALDLYSGFFSLTCREYEDEIAWMKKQLKYRGYEVQWDH